MKSNKLSIFFILPNLEGGGAERVVLTLLRQLERRRYDLHLLVFQRQGPLERDIPDDIIVYDLQADRVLKGFYPFRALLKKERPDLIFSTLTHLNLIVLFTKTFFSRQTKVVIRETTMVSRNLSRLRFSPLWKILITRFYPRSERIVCSCRTMAEDLRSLLPGVSEKLSIIPNPLDRREIERKIDKEGNPFADKGPGPHVLAVGRLSPEKGMGRLIQSFSLLAAQKRGAKLWILGEGEEKRHLSSLIRELNLADRVCLKGFQTNPYPWMAHADLFVLPSLYEGTPNALLEALACGAPVVVLEQEGGAQEVLEKVNLSNRYVPSLDPWSEYWWERPPEALKVKLDASFGVPSVVDRYEELFSTLCKKA